MKIRKKHVLIISPFVVIVLLASVVFFYGMSRNYEEPEDTVAGVGLSDVMAKPTSGTPADFTPEQNAAIALGVIRDIGKYNTVMTGDIDANIGFMTYVQNMKDTKIINGDEMYQESVSLSSMANVAQQKYIQGNNNIYLVRSADKINGQDVTWSNDITPISKDTYTDTYGLPPNGISPYVVSKSTILSAQVVEQGDGKYVYTYDLNPDTAPAYYRRQVKTLSGSQKNPLFHSVKLTIEMDQDWKPTKVTMNENYDISIPVMGSANCTTEFTELYQDYGKEQTIPDKDIYTTFIRDKYDPNKLGTINTSGDMDIKEYLGKVFGADDNGIFRLKADLTLNGDFQNAYIQGNLQTDTYQIQMGDVFGCLKGDKLYLNYGNLKYYVTVDGLMDALQDVADAAGFEMPDFNENSMDHFMKNMTTTQKDGMQEMTMNANGMNLVVHLEDGTMKLLDATVNANIGGLSLNALVKPTSENHIFPRIDSGYENMMPLLDYINPVIHLVNANSWEFDTSFALKGQLDTTIHAYVKMVRAGKTINAQIDTDLLGQHLTVRLINGMAYVDYGNLKLSLHTTNLNKISSELQAILPLAAGDFNLSDILPQSYLDFFAKPDINSLIRNMTPIKVQGNTVSLGFKIGSDTIKFSATKKGQLLTKLNLDGITVNASNVSGSVKLTALNAPRTTITVDGSGYTKLEDVLSFIEPVMNAANGKTIDMTANVMLHGKINFNQNVHVLLTKNGNGFDAALSANVLGNQIDLKFINGTAYIAVGNVKLKLHTTDINEIIKEIKEIAPIGGDLPDLTDLFPQEYVDLLTNFNVESLLKSIKSLNVDSNQSKMTLKVGDGGLRLEIGRNRNKLSYIGFYDMPMQDNTVSLQANVNSVSAQSTNLTVDDSAFTDVADLAKFAKPVKNTMNAKSYVFDVDLHLKGDNALDQQAKVTIVRKGSATDLEVTADVFGNPLSIKVIDNTAYIQYGAIKISADQYDIGQVLNQILPGAMPKELTDFLSNFNAQSMLDSIQSIKANGNTASVGIKAGNSVMTLDVVRNDDFLISGHLSGLTIDNNQIDVGMRALYITSEQLPITVNASAYTKVSDAMPTIQAIINTLNASHFQFDAQIKLSGEQNLTQTAKVKLSRAANGYNGEVETMVMGDLLNIKWMDGVTYVQYGKIKLRLDAADMDSIVNEIKSILPQDAGSFDLSSILPQTYIDEWNSLGLTDIANAFRSNQISVDSLQPLFQLIGNIQTFEVDGNGTTVALNFGGDTITLQMGRSYDYITQLKVSGITVQNSKLELNVTNGVGGKLALPIRLDSDDYADAADLAGFVTPVQNLLNANSYDFDVTLDLKGDTNLNQTANVKLVRDGSNVKAVVATDLYGKALKVTYIDGVTYIEYGNLKFKVSTNDIGEIQTELAQLLPQGAGNLDVSGLIPQTYLDYFQSDWTFNKILDSVQSIRTNGNTVYADLKIGDDTITVSATREGQQLTNATVTGITAANGKLNLHAAVNQISTDSWDVSVNPDEYFELKQLLSLAQAAKSAVDATSYDFDVNLNVTGKQTLEQTAQVRLVRGAQGVSAQVTAQLEGETLLVQYHQGVTYIQYGNMKLKLNNADANSVLQTLKELLPEGSLADLDLSAFVPQAYIDQLQGLQLDEFIGNMQAGNINQTTIEPIFKMLQMVESFTMDDTSATCTLNVGGDSIPIRVEHDGTNITSVSADGVSALNSKLRIHAAVTQMTTETLPLTPCNDADFTDVKQVMDFMPALVHTVQANRYKFTSKLTLGDQTADVNVTVIRRDTGADAQVTTTIGGAELKVQYIAGTTYVQYGNIKLMLHNADLQAIMDEIKAVLPTDTPAFDLSAILPQAYVEQWNALGIDQLIADMQAGNVNRGSIAPILKLAQKVKLSAQPDTLTVSAAFGGDTINVALTSKDGLLHTAEIHGLHSMGRPVTVTAQMTQVGNGIADLVNDGTGFENAADAIGFVKPMTQLVTANTVEFTVNGIASGKLNTEQSATVRVQRTNTGANAEVLTNLYQHDLSVKLIDGVTYVDYANVKLQLHLTDVNAIADEIRAILPQDSSGLDLTKLVPQSYIDAFESLDPFALAQKIDHLTINENQIGFDLKLSDTDVIHVAMNKDENQALSADVSGLKLYDSDVTANAVVTNVNREFTIEAQGTYANAKQIAAFAKPVMDTVHASNFSFDTNIVLNGSRNINQNAAVKLILHKDDTGAIQSVDAQAETQIEGRTLSIKMFGTMTYIQYGDIKIKLDTNDVDTIMTRLREILPEGTLGENADLSGMLPAAYTDLFQSFADGTVNIQQLIGSISNVTVSDNTLGATIQIGDDSVTAQLSRQDGTITGLSLQGVTVAGNQLNAVLDHVSIAPVAIDPVSEPDSYINASDLVDFVDAGMNSYQQLNSQIFNAKADLKINGQEVKATVYNNRLYLYYHDTTQYKVGGAPYTGIKLQMDYNAMLDLAATGVDLMEIKLPADVKQHILGNRVPLDTSVLSALPIPTLDELLASNNVSSNINFFNLVKNIQKQGDTLIVTLSSKELFGDAAMPDTVVNVTKANNSAQNVISQITIANTGNQDTSITAPSDAGNYMDVSSLNTFADSLIKTADLKQYRITGNIGASMHIIGIPVNANVPMDFRLKLNEDNTVHQAYIKLEVPYFFMVLQQNMTTKIYYDDGVLYFDRNWETSKGWFWSKKYYDHHEYTKCTMDEFMADPMKYVYFSTNFTGMVEGAINDAIAKSDQKAVRNGDIMFEEAWTGFHYNGSNQWDVNLDAAHLINNSDFSDNMTISLGRGSNGIFNKINLSTKVLGFINLQLNNGQLVNADHSNVDMSVVPANLKQDANYAFGQVKVVETKK